MGCGRLLVHVCSCVFCYDPETKWSIELISFLSGSFVVEDDPEPSDRVSEEVQLKVGMAEDREPLTSCTSVPARLAPGQASPGVWLKPKGPICCKPKKRHFMCPQAFPSTSC